MNQNNIIGDSFLGSRFFDPDYLFSQGLAFFRELFDFTSGYSTGILSIFYNILFFFGLFFLIIISYTMVRMFEIRKKERKHLEHEIAEYARHQVEREKKLQSGEEISKNPRWIKTLSYLFSQHASDWKLAVIEADSMLEDLLSQLGFKGDTLGDKLKDATQPARAGGDKFRSLTSAWEVHTIRNKIAHEGAIYEMTQREAKRVIAIYEQIFREYGYI